MVNDQPEPPKRTRRLNGQGTEPVKIGNRWVTKIYVTNAITGERTRERVSAKTKTEATKLAQKKLREAESGFVAKSRSGEQTVESYGKIWVEQHLTTRELTENSLRQYEQALRNHVLPVIGNMKLSKVRESDIRRIDSSIKARDLSDASRRAGYNAIKSLFDYAVKDQIVRVSPVANVDRPSAVPTRQPHYGIEDAQRLVAACKGDRTLRHMVPLMLCTGIRPGEAFALVWDDVYLDDVRMPYVIVCATNAVDKQGRVFRQTFTKRKRIRTVPLLPDAVAVLRAAKTARAADRLAAGEAWEHNGLVFPNELGQTIDDRNYRRNRYAPIVKSLNLKGSFQALRRSVATQLTGEDVALVTVRDILGHSSTATTQAHYTIIDVSMKADALSKLNGRYKEAQ